MSHTRQAVFLSYASQDAEAAKRICDALRGAGVEVWFDQNELVGGDAWDQKIRKQIKDCALLIPIISANTQSRTEGYFRLEWRLADQRTHLMAKGRAFLLPVVIDDTKDSEAHVPDSFTEVQWTRLKAGENAGPFAARVKKLLEGSEMEAGRPRPAERGEGTPSPVRSGPSKWWWALPVLGVAVASFFVVKSMWRDLPAVPATVKSPPPGADATMSEARQLVARAQPLHENMGGSTRGDFELAGDLLKRALELAPLDAEVWAHYSWFCNNMYGVGLDRSPERDAEIKRSADRAFKLDPKSPMARMAWANYYRRQSAAREAAIRMLRELVQEHPDNVVMLRVLASALRSQPASLEEALALLARAAALPGADSHAWTIRGDILSGLGRVAEAEAAYDRSLEIRRTPRVLVRKALLLMRRTGDFAAAEKLLSQVPGDFVQEDRFVGVACQLALLQRKPERCLEILEGFPREYVEDGNYVILAASKGSLAGLARWEQGKPELARLAWAEGLRSVEQRLAIKPTDETLLWDKGFLLAALNRRSEAEEVATLFGQLDPSNVPLMRAMIDAWTGEKERALQFLASQPPTPCMGLGPLWGPLLDEPEFKRMVAVAIAAASSTPELARPSLTRGAADEIDRKSVAVLAFANLSDDKNNEYFSDGISEELLNVLAKVPGLKVSARTSAFYFKGKEVPIPEIAKQLGVAYVIEGSVRKQGDKVRITAQLIKAADGFHVWSDTFTRDLKDIFAVQDEIAGLIAGNLSLKLGVSLAATTASVNPAAFELYVQGRQAWNLRTDEGFDRAEQLLNRALVLAPNFARAHAALADVALLRAINGSVIGRFDQRHSPEQARLVAQIQRVLALDPDLAEAHASLGFALEYGWDFDGAERELRRAIALNPNYAPAHQWLGTLLMGLGRVDEALAEMKLASEIDPLSSRILDNYGRLLTFGGRYREALAVLDRARALQPDSRQAQAGQARVLILLGRVTEAVALARQFPDGNTLVGITKVIVLAQAGLQAEAEASLPRVETKNADTALLALGRGEEALAVLGDPANVSVSDALQLFFHPLYDAIRADPRFVKLLATLGLTEAHARAQAWRKAHPPEKPAK